MKASLNKISKSFYINLDRRQDRRDHIESTLPFLCERSPAVDGQSLELNPLVKKIFSNLDKITKAEAACAMSHYMIWKTLLNDDSSDNYLILEDDVVFEKGFATFWNHGQSLLLPKDYSLIYLGGCQPWNKPQYHKCLERYNDCFNRIKKTDFFQPDSHYWHMNASSYILSKKGAKVLCDFVDNNGFTLSLDHFMIYIINDYNSDSLYHLNPLVARQLHEENENTGEDAHSDIRRNTTKFEESKKIAYFYPSVLKHKGIEDCDYDILKIKEPSFNYLNVIWQGVGGKTKKPWDDPDQDFIIESDWLLYLLGDIELNHINDDNYSVAQDNSIVIYSDIWPSDTKRLPEHLHQKCKDNNLKIKNYFEKFKDFKNCYLIHLSDEHCLAETSHYKYFKHVFRNIYRDDIADKNVTFFPLGYKSKEIKKTQEQLIPKKIHQTWETKNITPGIQSYIDKLKNLNPDFDYELYDKDDRETFLKEHFDDKVFEAYSRIVPGAMKTDLWRYCLLYKYGGIFSDIDLDYISPLPEVINGFSFACSIDLDNDFNSPHQALNGFLCSSPGHPILKHCIDLVVSNVIDGDWDPLEHHCLDLSGPGALGMSINSFIGRGKRSPLNPMFGEHEISDYKIKLIRFIDDIVQDINGVPIFSCDKGPGTDLGKAYKELSKQDNVISWADNNFSARKIVYPSKEIPKVIVQACGNEILLNDSNYEYSRYNKEDCVEFLYKYFNELVVDTFNSLDSELEKSNFFKHCYLYIKGGSYIDSSPPGLSTHLSEIESIIRSTNE